MLKGRSFNSIVHSLFVRQARRSEVQFFRYGFVGGFSAIVDISTLALLTSVAGIHYLISAAMAFILGTIVNYWLSVLWIFERSTKKRTEITLFTMVGLVGLFLNEIIIWFMVEEVGLFYLAGKIVSVSIVFLWSFNMRRLLFIHLNRGKKVNN